MDLFGEGQRTGDRSPVLREDFWHVPAPAQTRRVRRNRHRFGHLQENCRAAWRHHLSRVTARARFHVSIWPGRRRKQIMNLIGESMGGKGMPIEVLLVEDSPGDVRLTREAFGEA